MNGETTKYYKYKNTSGKLNLSPSTAKTLNWEHGDEIRYVVKTIEGQIGLFFFKKESE
jgi:formylmethanofuran dehydrogenase subunit D